MLYRNSKKIRTVFRFIQIKLSLTHDNTEMVAFVICIRCFLWSSSCSLCLWCQQRSEGVYTCRRTDSLADVLQLIVDKDVSDCLTSFRAFDLAVMGSIPGRVVIKSPRSINSAFHPFGVGKSSTSLHWLGLRWDVFACVGWQVTLCDSIWQMTPCSSEMAFSWRTFLAVTSHSSDSMLVQRLACLIQLSEPWRTYEAVRYRSWCIPIRCTAGSQREWCIQWKWIQMSHSHIFIIVIMTCIHWRQ